MQSNILIFLLDAHFKLLHLYINVIRLNINNWNGCLFCIIDTNLRRKIYKGFKKWHTLKFKR